MRRIFECGVSRLAHGTISSSAIEDTVIELQNMGLRFSEANKNKFSMQLGPVVVHPSVDPKSHK